MMLIFGPNIFREEWITNIFILKYFLYVILFMRMFSLIHKNNDVRYVKSNDKIHTCILYSNHGKVLIIQVFYDHAGNSDDSKAVKPALPKN